MTWPGRPNTVVISVHLLCCVGHCRDVFPHTLTSSRSVHHHMLGPITYNPEFRMLHIYHLAMLRSLGALSARPHTAAHM
jgi:hypothetical protein